MLQRASIKYFIIILFMLCPKIGFSITDECGILNGSNQCGQTSSSNGDFGEEVNEYEFNENFGGLVWVGDQLYAIDHPNQDVVTLDLETELPLVSRRWTIGLARLSLSPSGKLPVVKEI